MQKLRLLQCSALVVLLLATFAPAADWTRFRGPDGTGISDEKGLPTEWSSTKNIAWKTELPGPGTSSPIVLGDRVYLTCYTGYGLKPNEGDMEDLRRHVLCVDRKSGKVLWKRDFEPKLPESAYRGGNSSWHGYASSTLATDGERLYVFFGKSGVYGLDLEGKELWHAEVGSGTHGWGSANSPVLYKDLVIVNASVESRSLVAFDKKTGKEAWRVKDINASWNTPVMAEANGKPELVLNVSEAVLGLDPASGKELWRYGEFRGYVCPSVTVNNGVVYSVRGGAFAIRAGGRGDVSESHQVWRGGGGSTVPSPVYHDGHLYWVPRGGTVYCLNAKTGERVYQQRLTPRAGVIYASLIVADGKLYCVTQHDGTYVLAAGPEFKQLAHNVFEHDNSRTNASPIVSGGQLLMRTDRYLYCIGK